MGDRLVSTAAITVSHTMSVSMINKCHVGDCREILPTLSEVQMCVTSPPYWGLRDYGTATWNGGSKDCNHKNLSYPPGLETPGGRGGSMPKSEHPYREICGKCGARRIDKQLGLEFTPEEYVKNMVKVFRLVRDALADNGTLWLNLGDSYVPANRGENAKPRKEYPAGMQAAHMHADLPTKKTVIQAIAASGLKTKDLMGISWMVAFALRADGWYLRSDIVWHKPNPMPESVMDRPTKAHEYLFLLSKQAKYYYDADAIREPHKDETIERVDNWGRDTNPKSGADGKTFQMNSVYLNPNGRNKRSVWTIPTQPYPDAHFATFPEALVEPCILAGSKSGDVVLDPFFGSGTVGEVCERLGRKWIGIELNPEYAEMARYRTSQIGLRL